MKSNKYKQKVLFVLSIDTEEEWNWFGSIPEKDFSVENIRMIPKFQRFCNRLGVKPTYFIDYAVLSNRYSADVFRSILKNDQCEIGAHMHPWCNPPVEENISYYNSYIVNLPIDLFERKTDSLLKLINRELGIKPVSFRSGRWATNGKILRILADKGFSIDSSIYPYFGDSTFSYYKAPENPYWPDFSNILQAGNQKRIFEIPVSSGFTKKNFPLCSKVHNFLRKKPYRTFHINGILWRLGILRKVPFSPEVSDTPQLLSCAKACMTRGHRIIHMFLHSSSLLPGASYYVKDQADEEALYQRIEDVVNYIKSRADVEFCTLSEAKAKYLGVPVPELVSGTQLTDLTGT